MPPSVTADPKKRDQRASRFEWQAGQATVDGGQAGEVLADLGAVFPDGGVAEEDGR